MEKRVEIYNFGKPMVTCRARNGVVVFLVDPLTDVEHERRVINTMMAIYTAIEEADAPVSTPGIRLPERSRYRAILAVGLAATTVGAVLTLTLTGGTELADPRHDGRPQTSQAAGHEFGTAESMTSVATTAGLQPATSERRTPAPRGQLGSGRLHVFTPSPSTSASPQEPPSPATDLVSADSAPGCSEILCQVAKMLVGHA